jgi:two-component system, NarL family, sensor histidine kinase UhpB
MTYFLVCMGRIRSLFGSLAARAALAGAAVLVLVFVLLLVTPVEISAPIRLGQAIILLAGLLAMLVVQLLLVRRVLAPLRQLAQEMESVDLRAPEQLLPERPEQGREINTFVGAFNKMIDRLAEERRQSARAALGAQETERARTARELHDEVGQSLTAVALQVEQLAAGAEPQTAARLNELAAELYANLEDVRRIVRRLRPEALDDLGLVNALIALTSRIDRQSDARIERQIDADLPSLDSDQELVIYRVAQESLTNVRRHAEATKARLALGRDGNQVVLTVSDDGRGMPAGAVETGIEGMRERALLIGAGLTVHSEPQQGTEVRLVVPMEE